MLHDQSGLRSGLQAANSADNSGPCSMHESEGPSAPETADQQHPPQRTASMKGPTYTQPRSDEARERNRLAQKRYRDRQRTEKMQRSLITQHFEAEKERMQEENVQLAATIRVKEKMLLVKETMMEALEAHVQQTQVSEQASGQPPVDMSLLQTCQQLQQLPSIPAAQQQQQQQHALASEPMLLVQGQPLLGGSPLPHPQLQVPPAAHQRCSLPSGGAGLLVPGVLSPNAAAAPPQPAPGSDILQSLLGELGALFPETAEQQQQQQPPQRCGADRLADGAGCQPSVPSMPAGSNVEVVELYSNGRSSPTSGGAAADVLAAELQAIHLPEFDDPERRRLVEDMNTPEDFIQAWRRWQVEVAERLRDAEATAFQGEREMAALQDIMDHMVILFWYASQLKPGFAEICMVMGSPPPEVGDQLWRNVAAQIKLTPGEHSRLLKQWNLCCKRVAQANIKCSRWTAVLKREQQRAAAAAAAAAAGAAAGGVEAKFVSSAGGMEASMEGLSCSTGSPAADTPVQNAAAAAAAAAVAADAAVQAAAEQLWPQGSSWEAAGPAHMPGGTPPVHGPDSTSQGPGGSIAAEVGGLGDDRGMAAAAGSSLSVAEASARLAAATHEKDLAVKHFLGRLNWVLSATVKARINVLSAPYCPDFLSITRHLLYPEGGEGSGAAMF